MNPELDFICACCRWPDDGKRRQAISEASGNVRDWRQVAGLAWEHRVEGLVANGIAMAQVPDWVAAHFKSVAQQVKSRALQDVAETLRIAGALQRAGISYCILKGAPLGVRAFGSPLLKQSWDVDVLVDRADAVRTAEVVETLGYRSFLPPRRLTKAEFRRWSAVSKEAEFHSGDRAVELHWGLADHPMLLAGMGVGQATEQVDLLGGRAVPTLSDPANLAYLAVHGACHAWSRLKWLADFAAFLGSFPPNSRDSLVEEARAWQVGFAIEQALHLSRELLGSEIDLTPPAQPVEALVDIAKTAIARRLPDTDFDSDGAAALAVQRSRRELVPDGRYRRILLVQRLRGTEDRRHVPLPRGLRWLYWPMRPFGVAFRTFQRRIRSGGN